MMKKLTPEELLVILECCRPRSGHKSCIGCPNAVEEKFTDDGFCLECKYDKHSETVRIIKELMEEVNALRTVAAANEELVKHLKLEAIAAVRLMNSQAEEGDVLRNHVNYGIMTQALRTLRNMGFETEHATWGDGDLNICNQVTVNGFNIYKRFSKH